MNSAGRNDRLLVTSPPLTLQTFARLLRLGAYDDRLVSQWIEVLVVVVVVVAATAVFVIIVVIVAVGMSVPAVPRANLNMGQCTSMIQDDSGCTSLVHI